MPSLRLPRLLFLVVTLVLSSGCGAAQQTQAPGAPPTPISITKKQPGGDAHDAHFAALTRQSEAHFGWRTDKDLQARFPLPDRQNWTRVRFYMIDHFVGFKYGDDQHSVTAGFVVKMPPDAPKTSARCIEEFEKQSLPQVTELGGTVTDMKTGIRKWNEQVLVVRRATGHIRVFGKKYDAALAWAGYPAYEDGCLVYAVAVPWDGHQELAEQVRNQWGKGFRKFRALTTETPYRRK